VASKRFFVLKMLKSHYLCSKVLEFFLKHSHISLVQDPTVGYGKKSIIFYYFFALEMTVLVKGGQRTLGVKYLIV